MSPDEIGVTSHSRTWLVRVTQTKEIRMTVEAPDAETAQRMAETWPEPLHVNVVRDVPNTLVRKVIAGPQELTI